MKKYKEIIPDFSVNSNIKKFFTLITNRTYKILNPVGYTYLEKKQIEICRKWFESFTENIIKRIDPYHIIEPKLEIIKKKRKYESLLSALKSLIEYLKKVENNHRMDKIRRKIQMNNLIFILKPLSKKIDKERLENILRNCGMGYLAKYYDWNSYLERRNYFCIETIYRKNNYTPYFNKYEYNNDLSCLSSSEDENVRTFEHINKYYEHDCSVCLCPMVLCGHNEKGIAGVSKYLEVRFTTSYISINQVEDECSYIFNFFCKWMKIFIENPLEFDNKQAEKEFNDIKEKNFIHLQERLNAVLELIEGQYHLKLWYGRYLVFYNQLEKEMEKDYNNKERKEILNKYIETLENEFKILKEKRYINLLKRLDSFLYSSKKHTKLNERRNRLLERILNKSFEKKKNNEERFNLIKKYIESLEMEI